MTTYSVTIYTAAPGTPIGGGQTSAAGHMFYETKMDNQNSQSFGFAPAEHGAKSGPGKPYYDDVSNYQNPRYARTLEITQEQYTKLNEFGRHPNSYGFNTEYHGLKNSCIDYTWGALNAAGIHRQANIGVEITDTKYEGSLKPLSNIDDIKSIKPPIPNSPLNNEHWNSLPSRSLLQQLISENEPMTENQIANQNTLSHPLAADASRQEVTDFAFAALLSDDLIQMEKGLEQVFKTQVAQENMQQANEVVVAYDNHQAQIQQMNNPVMTMKI